MSKNIYTGIDQKIVPSVRYYAWKLKSNICFANEEIEDIEQELMLFVLSKLTLFKPHKSKMGTFVSNVLKNKLKNLIKAKMSQKNEFKYKTVSIDDRGLLISSDFEKFFLTADVNTFVHNNLPVLLQHTCELLKEYTVDEIAEKLGKSTSTIYKRISKIRTLMKDFFEHETESSALEEKAQNNTEREN